MSVNIVKTEFSREATILPPPESGGRVRYLFRRVLRRLGLMAPAPAALSLFQQNMGAYRFVSDDGRVSIVPVTMELVNDSAIDTEAMAREQAVEAMEKLVA